MKVVTLALAVVFAVALAASAFELPTNVVPEKAPGSGTPPKGTLQGGDTIETATVIPSLPYSTSGTTAGFNDDYDEVCPYSGSTSPDVVYAWTADFTGAVDIHTCESGFDTKLYVYENFYTPGAYYACNDDNASCPGPAYRSWIESMLVTEGNTYYIVVDGYGGDYGDYLFNMYEVEVIPCSPECPPYGWLESEPDCYDGYVDETNIGCNGDPPIFQYPPMNAVICGTSGNYDDNTYRDMDWFLYEITEAGYYHLNICADFQARGWIADMNAGCAGLTVLASEAGPAGYWFDTSTYLTAGTYTFIVSTDGWLDIPCGSPYKAQIFQEGWTAVEERSWGSIKALYK